MCGQVLRIQCNAKQRYAVNFYRKLKQNCCRGDCYVTRALGMDSLSITQEVQRYKTYKDGRKDTDEEQDAKRPLNTEVAINVVKIKSFLDSVFLDGCLKDCEDIKRSNTMSKTYKTYRASNHQGRTSIGENLHLADFFKTTNSRKT